jgi:hypothetical protein
MQADGPLPTGSVAMQMAPVQTCRQVPPAQPVEILPDDLKNRWFARRDGLRGAPKPVQKWLDHLFSEVFQQAGPMSRGE